MRVGTAFLVSATALLATSYTIMLGSIELGHGPGVPVKDYISQSGIFVLCAFALLYLALDQWPGYRTRASALAGLALLFLANIAFVTTSRTTLLSIPALYVVWGVYRLRGSWTLAAFLGAGVVLGALLWVAAPKISGRLDHVLVEISEYRATGVNTSAGARLAFWQDSLAGLREAPLIGHGTGTIAATLRRFGDAASMPANPHNEIFAIGIQFGIVGIIVLLAMWLVHWRLFFRTGPAGFFGLIAVTQNIIGSLFNSHLMDFTQSWIYVFAVGVFGAMQMSPSGKDARMRRASPLPSPANAGGPR
jgi:O-antigen ligase